MILAGSATAGPATAGSPQLCVGGKGCYGSVQAAVDAARPGSTIRVNVGAFAGGIRIDKSLRLVGAGAGRTILKGGDSVLRIESSNGRPTVTVSALNVTGGVSTHADDLTWLAQGGGILVDHTPDGQVGADVTLEGIVVTGNRSTPTTVFPSPSGAKCPDGDCPAAGSYGGGIANFGNLVVRNSVIRDNAAVGHVSDAAGGGIFSAIGSLLVDSTEVRGNTAAPDANEIGRYAEGGGLFLGFGGSRTVRGSRINENHANLVTPRLMADQEQGVLGKEAEPCDVGGGCVVRVVHGEVRRGLYSVDLPLAKPDLGLLRGQVRDRGCSPRGHQLLSRGVGLIRMRRPRRSVALIIGSRDSSRRASAGMSARATTPRSAVAASMSAATSLAAKASDAAVVVSSNEAWTSCHRGSTVSQSRVGTKAIGTCPDRTSPASRASPPAVSLK